MYRITQHILSDDVTNSNVGRVQRGTGSRFKAAARCRAHYNVQYLVFTVIYYQIGENRSAVVIA